MVLPENFDDIALGQKEIAKLTSFRKNPNRKQNDLDRHGNPIRTEL
jgi:hypothetical protein